MENALRLVSIERGRDPRHYAMVAFGGAGPLHAARMARSIGIPKVIVPNGAGIGSAIGLLDAEPRIDATVTRVMRLGPDSANDIAAVYRMLEARVRDDLERHGQGGELRWSRSAQMRYVGQGFEVHVDLPQGPIDATYAERTMQAFNQTYRRKHRFLDAEGTIEVVDWTLVGTLASRSAPTNRGTRLERSVRRAGTRKAWFPEAAGYTDTTVLCRQALAECGRIEGPAIIEDPDSTTVILPRDVARISPTGSIIIDIAGPASP
jgi:N-methylhydantoinase A